jgi:hypothetical protein
VALSLTPFQLKAICPEAPASAVLPLNAILGRTQSVTHLRAAMLVAQLAASSRSFRQLEEKEGPRGRNLAPYCGRGWIQLTVAGSTARPQPRSTSTSSATRSSSCLTIPR